MQYILQTNLLYFVSSIRLFSSFADLHACRYVRILRSYNSLQEAQYSTVGMNSYKFVDCSVIQNLGCMLTINVSTKGAEIIYAMSICHIYTSWYILTFLLDDINQSIVVCISVKSQTSFHK